MAQLLKQYRTREPGNSEEISPSVVPDTNNHSTLVRNHSCFVERTPEMKSSEKDSPILSLWSSTLINLEKAKWKGLLLAFRLGALGKWRNEEAAVSWFWGPNKSLTVRPGHKCGAPLLGPVKIKESHYHHLLGEECLLRSAMWGRLQHKAWGAGSLLLNSVTFSLFCNPGKLRSGLL